MDTEQQQSRATALEGEIASLRTELLEMTASLPAPHLVQRLTNVFRVSIFRRWFRALPRITGAVFVSALFASALARPSFWRNSDLGSALAVMVAFILFYVTTGIGSRRQRKRWMKALQQAVPREPPEPVEVKRPVPSDYRDAHGSLEQVIARLETERDRLAAQRDGLVAEQRSFKSLGRALLAATPVHRVDALPVPDWTWLVLGGLGGVAHRLWWGDNAPLFSAAAIGFVVWLGALFAQYGKHRENKPEEWVKEIAEDGAATGPRVRVVSSAEEAQEHEEDVAEQEERGRGR